MSIQAGLTKITAAEWASFESFLGYMPPQDEFLDSLGLALDTYKEMLIDDEIGADLELRKKKALNYPWTLSFAEESAQTKKIKDFIAEQLQGSFFVNLIESMLSALEYGFSINEIVWSDPKLHDGLWIPSGFILLKPERFNILPDGTLKMTTPNEKTLKQKFKFVVHTHGISPENPYGISVLRRCYWPWRFKKAGWKFWLIAAEKFGVPTVLVLFNTDPTMSEQEITQRAQTIAQMLQSIKIDAGAVLANVEKVEMLEAKGQSLSSFEKLIELCNRAISKAITGQTLASSEGKYGTRAQAEVHEDILIDYVESDLQNIAATLNRTLIPWLVELNFGANAPVPIFSFDTSEETPWERIKAAIDRGVPLSKKKLYSTYGLPEPTAEDDIFLSPKAGGMMFADKNFADGDPDFFVLTPRRVIYRPAW